MFYKAVNYLLNMETIKILTLIRPNERIKYSNSNHNYSHSGICKLVTMIIKIM